MRKTAPRSALGTAAPGFDRQDQLGKVSFGVSSIDEAIGGGLPRGALHEIFAARASDGAMAAAFGLGLACRASGADRHILWVRQDMVAREYGELYGPGLLEFGLYPEKMILVRLRDGLQALRAGHEALRCAALGAVIIELWGKPKALDLKATQKLARAAARSRVSVLLLRTMAEAEPSAALSRWSVSSLRSRPPELGLVDAPASALFGPGRPAFRLELLRHRAGFPPRCWHVEWNREQHIFQESSLSRVVAAFPADRPAASAKPVAPLFWRRAG
ncbi:ImuA family protein [Rhodoligotrophos ferricapiens]|uniref:ImuA family protein n=1 Tax=Rhodoligotrophos ferricapiens TaxID=3069264 RepID=UPI00315CC476